MTKFIYFICVISFFTHSVTAQNNWHRESDSLIALLSKQKTDTAKIDILNNLNTLLLSNDPGKAFEYSMTAMNISENIKDTARIVRSIVGICDFYTQMGQYSVSLEYSYHGIDLSDHRKSLLTLCHNRIANAQSCLGDFKEAISHHYLSMTMDKEIGDTQNIAIDLCNIGGCYSKLQLYDSALFYLRKANNRVIRLTGKDDPYSLTQIANTFIKMNFLDSALYYHLLAYYYDSVSELQYEMAMDEYNLAHTNFLMNRFSDAEKFAHVSLNRCKNIAQSEIPIDDYRILFEISSKEGDYKKAFEYSKDYNASKDSMRIKNRDAIIHGLEIKYKVNVQSEELKAKDIKMQLLKKQKSLFTILSLICILFVLSMIVALVLNYRKQKANLHLMEQLKVANNSKKSLLSVISHDLRGSVGTLRNAAKAISDGMTDIEDSRNLLESFYPIADSTYDLLENLLVWANLGKDNLTPVINEIDMKDIVDKSIGHVNHLALKKSIKIQNNLPHIWLEADRNMMLSVVRNLLTNAIKFSHPGKEILIQSTVDNEQVIISVQDFGIGLTPEALSIIFESPFDFHTNGTLGERGSGLGLSICKSFLQKHNGRLWAHSEEGCGSTFFFSLHSKSDG